jgi:hypothetical protein
MKKILLIIGIVSLFCGCPWPFLPEDEQKTIEDCSQWCSNNIKYKNDKLQFRVEDYWQTPDEVRKNKSGDCEDFCCLFLDMLDKRNYKDKCMYLIEKNDGRGHMLSEVNGEIYDITEGAIDKYESIYKYKCKWYIKLSFSEYIKMAEKNHGYYGEYKE